MNVDDLPPSSNKMSIGELLINFFQFYARDFDWRRHAVSMRRCARDEWDVGCRTTCPTSGLCWTKASSKEKG
ncbi:unnamed protein product [Cladocopium goreaui]|uniref:Terminal uridylyltransferase cid1 (TUTase cid1) (Caffeine-induced death protein 1) (Poly(A) polymerase cid1) (PAP) (Poly(U) polymerase cid1) (PUP) n=1 Tax=Cladocopium goreaui TaxID=2562237 RepID=A0A9P1CUI3_9DINO|nr:unnamed protein product [Cladocopium goreaui]